MGLRINTNTSSLDALRNLHTADRAQQRSLERLSSGLRINRGADDPSGLVISERLRSQNAALKQAQQNSQNAANLVSTADAALGKVSDLLIEIQDSVLFALNTGGASPDQIAAEQDSVDQAVAAIDRVANTTRYGDRSLLNGTASYMLANPISQASGTNGTTLTAITDLNFRSVNFVGADTQRDLRVDLGRAAQRAEIQIQGAGVSGATTTFRISGGRGTSEVTIASGASAGDISLAINSVADATGVYAQDDGSDVVLRGEGFGSDQVISLTGVTGALTGTIENRVDNASTASAAAAITANTIVSDKGLDGQVAFQGVTYTGKGLAFTINAPDANFSFNLNADLFHTAGLANVTDLASASTATTTGSGIHLVVNRTGLEFQLRDRAVSTDRLALGIGSVNTSVLGGSVHRDVIGDAVNGQENLTTASAAASGISLVLLGGSLSSLKTGQGNDLTQDAANALTIVNSAAASVAKSRGFLGAVVGFNLEPNIDSIDVATQNLSASLSSLRDLDFAEETANFTRTQILFQSGIAALASARVIPQSVLQLLGR